MVALIGAGVVVPVADAVATLPGTVHDLVGGTTFHVPYEGVFHVVLQNLSEHDSLVLALVGGGAVVVHVGGDLHARIADGVEGKDGHVEVDEVWVVAVDGVERAVVEVGDVLLRGDVGTAFPTPLAMDGAIVPGVVAEVVILCIEFLGVESLPPFLCSVGVGLVAVFLGEPAVVLHTTLVALHVETA